MRFPVVSLVVLLLCFTSLQADDAADAKAIVAKAVKAMGAKVDDKPVIMTWKDKGKFTGGGFEMEYKSDWAFQGPDKYRFVLSGDFNGMKFDLVVIVKGDKAWESAFGESREMTDEKRDYTLNAVYTFHVLSLVPLLIEKDFKLTTTGEKKIGDKNTQVVKVGREKRPTVTLYFD